MRDALTAIEAVAAEVAETSANIENRIKQLQSQISNMQLQIGALNAQLATSKESQIQLQKVINEWPGKANPPAPSNPQGTVAPGQGGIPQRNPV